MTAAITVEVVRERWRMGVEARALLLITAILLVLGLATVYSATVIVAQQKNLTPSYYLVRQLVGAGMGIVAFAICAKVDAERYRGWAWHIMIAAIVTMLAVLVLSTNVNGSKRFLFSHAVQPSEFAKVAVIIWTAMLAAKKGEQLRRLGKGLMPFFAVNGALAVLAILEPDVSVALFYMALMGAMLFIAGARVGHFLLIGLLVIPLAWGRMNGYVKCRIADWRDEPRAVGCAQDINLQTRQSMIAIGAGRMFGVGFGEGRQQSGFLPFQYTDFIGSNIGEEWGFVGIFTVVALFGGYAWLGFRIARDARTPFLQLVAVGLTLTTVTTAFVHLAVITGLFPNTGLTLPFISYGRSNLLISLMMTGMLVNIGSTRERVYSDAMPDPILGLGAR
ncbi:MAG: FtsW/RodA/SpoVE family cell cycle protein [Gemmatimonadaceae bacterium]|nr:FtsW/RodA/SpoVE family cell cycle protein [Gemmatimonadaceae bacterium]